MNLSELLQSAIARQREGDLEQAAALFKDILAENPDHPDALHYFGVLLHHVGEPENAVALIEKSLSLDPAQPSALNNLGNLYRLRGRDDEALAAYWTAIRLDSAHADAWRNLADLQRGRDDPAAAVKSLKIALTFEPDNFGARHWLGLLTAGMGDFDAAAEIFLATVRDDLYDPGNVISYADILSHHGKPEKALELVLEWQKKDPDDPLAAHHVNALRGVNTAAPGETYVRRVFDGFAETFEDVLKGLDYDAPAIIARTLEGICGDRRNEFAADLGCGTGLLGELIKPKVAHLTGIDLSPKMLAEARKKRVYDHLVEADIAAFLRAGAPARFDLVTAAEVLNYIGDIRPVFDAVALALRPGGLFAATYEILYEDDDPGYRLQTSGRYAHDAGYLKSTGAGAGLTLLQTERIPLRKSFDDLVDGFLMVFVKPDDEHDGRASDQRG